MLHHSCYMPDGYCTCNGYMPIHEALQIGVDIVGDIHDEHGSICSTTENKLVLVSVVTSMINTEAYEAPLTTNWCRRQWRHQRCGVPSRRLFETPERIATICLWE